MYTIRYTYDYSVPSGWPQHPYKNAAGDVPGAPVMYTQPQDPEDVGAGYGYSNAEGFTEDVFFYHSDHLGSTSYVTDGDGNATQFVAYTPFGETLVDEHAVTFETPYKFNGKEMDAETGLYYYGARYYDPSLALWYGVDALAEKYPSLGGYVYCANNPVRLIDPDGNDWYENSETGAVLWRRGHDNSIVVDGVVYSNIGDSYSYQTMDDFYVNYYQCYITSISRNKENGFTNVVNSDYLSGKLMSRKSFLDNDSKVAIMQERVRTAGIGSLLYGRGHYEYYASVKLDITLGPQVGVKVGCVDLELNGGALQFVTIGGSIDSSGLHNESGIMSSNAINYSRSISAGLGGVSVSSESNSVIVGGKSTNKSCNVGAQIDCFSCNTSQNSNSISFKLGGKFIWGVELTVTPFGIRQK